MDEVVYASVLTSLLATLFMTQKWIGKAISIGIVGKDMNKPDKPEVAEMGGVGVVFGFVLGVLMYIGINTFYFQSRDYLSVLAVLCTVLMITIIGILDDILGWKKGITQWKKPLLTIPAAVPIMVINAGHSTMNLPIIGPVDWGILYPLAIVPIGIVGASNAYNMLAGYNGLEAGMGAIILSTLGYVAYVNNKIGASVLAFCMVGALLAFLYFNWYPAKVFPGDSMTYSVGALVACTAILGDMEKIAVLLFIPYVIDFILPMRKGLKVEAFAKVNDDGSLEQPYDKIYDTSHLAIAVLKRVKSKVYEKDVVLFLCGIELVLVGLVWVVYL
ncbi:MAG TPA: hypothetical protein PLY09_00550 [Methanothrix sp.]|nr:hypothetical protein [Methanothrix sp.]HPJ83232.1 hypothetical protein [Methanothrix sp.]